jgi:hypothetical protein
MAKPIMDVPRENAHDGFRFRSTHPTHLLRRFLYPSAGVNCNHRGDECPPCKNQSDYQVAKPFPAKNQLVPSLPAALTVMLAG